MSATAEPIGAVSAPEPEFAVLGARAVRHSATPRVAIDLEASEPSGRRVHLMALRISVMLEPARRSYDDAAHDRLVELFGPPERWSVTTRSILFDQRDVVVPAFTGRTVVEFGLPCGYDQEVAASRYISALADGEVPMALHFNGTVHYEEADGRPRIVLVPWSRSIDFHLPVAVWREAIEHHYPDRTWAALRPATLARLEAAKRERHLPTLDAAVDALLSEAGGEAGAR